MRQGASQFSSLSLYGRDLPPHPGPSPLARGGIAARRIPKSEALVVMEKLPSVAPPTNSPSPYPLPMRGEGTSRLHSRLNPIWVRRFNVRIVRKNLPTNLPSTRKRAPLPNPLLQRRRGRCAPVAWRVL